MPKKSSVSLFRRLNRLFRSGPQLRRKIRTSDTTMAVPDKTKSSGVLLFQKSMSPTYATITSNAYNLSERLMRYQDFQEMEYTPELAAALDIYADESVPQDEKGRILHIYSENEKIKEILEDLYYNVLNVDFNLRPWVRNLVKYGDFFLYNDVHPEYGVMNAFPIPVNEVEREENYDREDPFAVRFRWVTLGNRTLENWEVSHFRLLGNDMFLPYGSSVIEPARRIWRQLILIEDAMLVYRVVRAPERRVFYIDVANIPPDEVENYINQQKQQLRSSQVIDRDSGRVDLRYNPLSVDEDYFIPVRGSESGTKIDTLAGGQNTAAVDDVEYIQKKMIAALKIPRAYLGYDDMLSSKATLAQEDIRFARTINAIQKTLIAELNKIAIIHLYAHGYTNEDLMDFSLRLTSPSTVAEQQKLELWRARFEIAGSAPEGMLQPRWLMKNILNMTDKEVRENAAGGGGEGGGGGSGGGGGLGDLGGGGDDIFGGGEEGGGDFDLGGDLGGEEGGGDEDDTNNDEEEDEDLTAGDDHDEDDEDNRILTSGDDQGKSERLPVKPSARTAHNRKVRHAKSGHADVGMSDFSKMVKPDTFDGTYDSDFFRTSRKNDVITPLSVSEGDSRFTKTTLVMSPDIVSMLERMTAKIGIKRGSTTTGGIITEGLDVQREIDALNSGVIDGLDIDDWRETK